MSLEMEGLGATNQMLLDAAARGEDMRPGMERVKVLFIEGHKENFASRGGFLGHPWAPDSPETLLRKAREGVPSLMDVMVASGDLQEALSGGKGSRTRVSRGSVRVGVKQISALFSQGGASGARRGEQPARPVVGINEAERRESLSILTDFLVGR